MLRPARGGRTSSQRPTPSSSPHSTTRRATATTGPPSTSLTDEAIEAISRRSTEIPASPSQLFILPWGGQIGRVDPETSPLAGRETAFVVHPLLLWENAADDERMIALGRAYREDLALFSTGATYLNFVGDEGEDRVRAGFGRENYERLARIKAKWDPDRVFNGNQSLTI